MHPLQSIPPLFHNSYHQVLTLILTTLILLQYLNVDERMTKLCSRIKYSVHITKLQMTTAVLSIFNEVSTVVKEREEFLVPDSFYLKKKKKDQDEGCLSDDHFTHSPFAFDFDFQMGPVFKKGGNEC